MSTASAQEAPAPAARAAATASGRASRRRSRTRRARRATSTKRQGSNFAVDTRNCASAGLSSTKSSVPLRMCSTTAVRLGLTAPSSTARSSVNQATTTSASGNDQPATCSRTPNTTSSGISVSARPQERDQAAHEEVDAVLHRRHRRHADLDAQQARVAGNERPGFDRGRHRVSPRTPRSAGRPRATRQRAAMRRRDDVDPLRRRAGAGPRAGRQQPDQGLDRETRA